MAITEKDVERAIRKLSRSSRIAGKVRMKSPKAPPRITRMRPGTQALEETLLCSPEFACRASLGPSHDCGLFQEGASCFLCSAPLFVLRTADEPQGRDAAQCRGN